jgi:hypothetical protein
MMESIHLRTGTAQPVERLATGWTAEGRSSNPGGVKNFGFSTASRPALRPTQPPIEWVPGALHPGVKRPGREADNSPPTSAEVKKTWIYTSTSPLRLQVYFIESSRLFEESIRIFDNPDVEKSLKYKYSLTYIKKNSFR